MLRSMRTAAERRDVDRPAPASPCFAEIRRCRSRPRCWGCPASSGPTRSSSTTCRPSWGTLAVMFPTSRRRRVAGRYHSTCGLASRTTTAWVHTGVRSRTRDAAECASHPSVLHSLTCPRTPRSTWCSQAVSRHSITRRGRRAFPETRVQVGTSKTSATTIFRFSSASMRRLCEVRTFSATWRSAEW